MILLCFSRILSTAPLWWSELCNFVGPVYRVLFTRTSLKQNTIAKFVHYHHVHMFLFLNTFLQSSQHSLIRANHTTTPVTWYMCAIGVQPPLGDWLIWVCSIYVAPYQCLIIIGQSKLNIDRIFSRGWWYEPVNHVMSDPRHLLSCIELCMQLNIMMQIKNFLVKEYFCQ